ncbi:MAG TPA: ABATE domain-containing protein [Bryobacteraceae bacterium]|nr:ABATE domain-containing protein [Bryobacteraceae bacterium]
MDSDWRDGFPFVGNHLALDFLNTRPVMGGEPVEMLLDGGALARWMSAAGLVNGREAARLGRQWKGSQHTAAITKIHELRESLRRVVLLREAGEPPPSGFVKSINRLLLEYPVVEQIVEADSGLERHKQFVPELPEDVFAPLADAIAVLLTLTDWTRVRKCRQCVLHFWDTSKKGTRVWCSMNMCGNRSKVAAFADRKRAAVRRK